MLESHKLNEQQPSGFGRLDNSLSSLEPPSGLVECAYYLLLVYATLGNAWGLAVVGMLGGALQGLLAMYCLLRRPSQVTDSLKLVALPLAFGVSMVLVQVLWHGESLMDSDLRAQIVWMFGIIIVYSLCLRRGFLERFFMVLLALGLAALPYMEFQVGGEGTLRAGLERASQASGELRNPNGLAAWFGFCAVCAAIIGIETKRLTLRILFLAVAIGCLLVAGLTVSRGALLAAAIALLVAFRRLFRRGFLPILVLSILGWLGFELGMFDQIIRYYLQRATEDTGRLLIWTVASQRLLDAPLLGVGLSEVVTYIPGRNKVFTPHNSFLFVALSSGLFVVLLYVAFWTRAAVGALTSIRRDIASGPFLGPLVVYTLLQAVVGDRVHMTTWGIVSLSAAAVAARGEVSRRVRQRAKANTAIGRRQCAGYVIVRP